MISTFTHYLTENYLQIIGLLLVFYILFTTIKYLHYYLSKETKETKETETDATEEFEKDPNCITASEITVETKNYKYELLVSTIRHDGHFFIVNIDENGGTTMIHHPECPSPYCSK